MDTGQAGDNVPPGWKRTMNVRGRIQYESPAPVVNIRSKSQLLRYQKDGKFLELKAESVNFMVKRNRSLKNYIILDESINDSNPPVSTNTSATD